MTKKEFDLIGSMNMCDEISNEAYKKIMVYCEEQEPCKDAISREEVLNILKAEWVLDKPIEEWSVYRDVTDLPPVTPIRPKGYLSIEDVMSVFDDFMCGEVDEEGTETFLEMLKDRAESEDKE